MDVTTTRHGHGHAGMAWHGMALRYVVCMTPRGWIDVEKILCVMRSVTKQSQ